MPTSKEQKSEGWVSVTEVLDSFIPKGLLSWYLKTGAKEAKRLSTVALKIGSRVDELIQEDISKGSYKLSSKDPIEVKNCMDAWKQFKADYNPNIVRTQAECIDIDQKLIGHIDLIMNNRVVDIKCASSIKQNHWLQVSKYSHMEFNLDINPIIGVAILRLDKNLGTYQFITNEQAGINWKHCVKVFDGLLEAYRFYNPPTAVKEVVSE